MSPTHDSTPAEHKSHAPKSVNCYVLTVSDSRTPETDEGGRMIRDMLTGAGHVVVGHGIEKDDPNAVELHVQGQLITPDVQVIITTGGTGITSRDGTFEAIDGLLTKKLEGFGELFRMLSYAEIGSSAMMSRATAGTAMRSLDVPTPARPKAIFVLPGSPDAVKLAMTKLILPELGHVVQQLNR
jgi:molybdopterin adenylyltransferase